MRNKAEKVLFGNIIGSNIINILGALGISSLIGTIIVPEDFSGISFYYLIFTAIWLLILTKIKIHKSVLGLVSLAAYIYYVFSLY